MKDIADQEVIDIGDMDVEAFNELAVEQGWSDGMPLYLPTEEKVARFVETVRGDNRPYAPVPPRQIVPTVQSIAANAVMAGCKPEYFPVVTAALRGVLDPEYNLHGSLATTHSCAPMVMVSGPIRHPNARPRSQAWVSACAGSLMTRRRWTGRMTTKCGPSARPVI